MVLSDQAAPNHIVGGIGSPKDGGSLRKVQSPSIHQDDKENAPSKASVSPLETTEQNLDKDMEEVEGSPTTTTSPKRVAEDIPEGSPENHSSSSSSKKARKNDNDDEDQVEGTSTTAEVVETSPPKTTSGSSKSVDDLLADLAKAKSALMQSKDTLKLLKEHQQKLAENGASMGARVEAFDKELTKLKETHAENGKELERVLSLRESANKTFQAAEETLRKISEKQKATEDNRDDEDEDDGTSVVLSNNKKNRSTNDTATTKTDSKMIVEEEEGTLKACVSPATSNKTEVLVVDEVGAAVTPNNTIDDKEEKDQNSKEAKDTTATEMIRESSTTKKDDIVDAEEMEEASLVVEDKDLPEDKEAPKETKEEVKEVSSPTRAIQNDDVTPTNAMNTMEKTTTTLEITTDDDIDEKEIEEAKQTLDLMGASMDESTSANSSTSPVNNGKEAKSGTESIQAKPSLSTAATIDDTLALELQNTDGGDSDDDLLM